MFNDTPARKADRLLGAEKGKCMKWLSQYKSTAVYKQCKIKHNKCN